MWYDTTQKAFAYYNDVTNNVVHIGQETQLKVYNNTGSTITRGAPVYVTSTSSGFTYPLVALAKADTQTTGNVIGLANQDIPTATAGYITTAGLVSANTGSFAVGDTLYVSPYSAGQLMNTVPPTGYAVKMGVVAYANTPNGFIYVNQSNAYVNSAQIVGTVAIANGGTAATTASGARTNLGLGTIATQDASNVTITGGSISGITALPVASGGTSGTTAATARSGIGAVGLSDTQTLTNKTIDASANTLSNIPNSALTNSSITINGTSASLGGSLTIAAATSNALTAGTGLTGGIFDGSAARTWSLAPYGTAGTYGATNQVSFITTDAYGRVTSVAGNNISIVTSQISNIGTIATQNANNVAITGGTINSTQVLLRTLLVANVSSITPNIDLYDVVEQANTQAAGTLTINLPTGTPVDGQRLILRISSTNIQTFNFNTIYVGSTDLSLPATTSGSSKYDYLGFMYNSTVNKWQLLASMFGF